MANDLTHAKNPSLNKEGLPKEQGETRDINGQLEYLNPMTDQWEYAVRLHDIRQRVLQGDGRTYNIPKKHGNAHAKGPLNYTSFLARDQPYGPLRANRNPILFQLKPTDSDVGVEPTGYVLDHGDIVLDAFDHGIRDFGNAMPLCLSTEIEGHDIETYKRRNMKIALYDIIARMPGGFWTGSLGQTWRDKPPRAGSVSMRATRFRLRAGCLTWNEKGDSDAKNTAMMMLMSPNVRTFCETNNSTNLFRDLSKSEQTQCETATGHRPGKASKANRAKKQAEIQEDSTDQEDDAEAGEGEEEDDEDAPRPNTRPIAKPTSRKGLSRGHIDAKTRTQKENPAYVFEHLHPDRGCKRFKDATFSSEEDVEESPSKLRRTSQWQDLEESSSEYEPASVERPTIQTTTRRARTHFQSSRADAESALAFEEAIADALKVPQSNYNFKGTHGLEYLSDDEKQDTGVDPRPWSLEVSARGNTLDEDVDKKGVLLNLKPGTPLPRRHSKSDSAASDQLGEQVLQFNTISGEDRQSVEADEEVDVVAASRQMSKTAKRSTARKEPKNTRLADNMRSATQDNCSLEAVDTTTADRRKLKQAIRRDAQEIPYSNHEQLSLPGASPFADDSQSLPFLDFGGEVPYTNLAHILPFATFSNEGQPTQGFDLNDIGPYPKFPQLPLSTTPNDTYPFSDGLDPHTISYAANSPQLIEHGRSSDFIEEESILGAENISSPSSYSGSTEVGFDPTCEEFQSEVATGVEAGDYRYVSPVDPEDIRIVKRVLELSRADFFQKTGHRVPEDVVDGYEGETYASQQQRLDAHFESGQIEAGNHDGDSIYCLPEWFGGFNDLAWRTALDEEGMRLEDVTQDYDF